MNKLFKKFLSLALCTGIVLSLAACGGTPKTSPEESSKGAADSTTASKDSQADTKAENMNFEEEPYEVIIENMTLGQNMSSLEAVEEAINAITLPAINCTVKISNIHIADHATKISLMAAGGEKFDLITTGRTVPLSQMVSDGILLPLDDLLAERGQTLVDKAGNLMDACVVGENIYAVPADFYPGSKLGFLYNVDMADRLGIKVPEKPTWEELEAYAQTLKANDVYLLSQGNGEASSQLIAMMFPSILSMGASNYIYGIIDDVEKSTEIVNLFESEYYKEYCHRMRKWLENGWIPSDSIVSGQNNSDVFKSEQTFLMWTGVSPTELALQAKSFPVQIDMFAMADGHITTSNVQEVGWGISITSKRPEKAMDFLNFIYENADVANLFMNGIEGTEYKKVSDHIITFADGVDSTNIGYSRNFSVFGDKMQTFQWQPATEDYYDDVKAFADEIPLSPLLGYTFDASLVSTQIAAVSNVISEYMPSLECGVVEDVDGAIADFNKALEEAGIHHIIKENQLQLDAWLASKK